MENIKSNRIGRWLWAGAVLTVVMIALILIRIQLQRRAVAALPIASDEYHDVGMICWAWDACGFDRATLPWQPALKSLWLFSEEGLSDQQVKILADQHTLERLEFRGGCQMSRAAWERLRSLNALKDFAWYAEPIPGSLDVLPPQLKQLNLIGCGLTDANSKRRTPFNCVTAILSNNNLSAAALQIFDADTLQTIEIDHNPIGNDIFETLRGFKAIQSVGLSHTLIDDNNLPDLSWVRRLDSLHVSNTQVGDRFAALITEQPLESLSIEQTAISPFAVSRIMAAGLVKYLFVDESQLPVGEAAWKACKVPFIGIKLRLLNGDRFERGESRDRDKITKELMEADDESLRALGAAISKCAPPTTEFRTHW